MDRIILAGATGYLGTHLIKALEGRDIPFWAIARRPEKLEEIGLASSRIIAAEVTRPISLESKLKGADTLISTIGITRQQDGLTYMDVDYRANLNLLEEAKRSGIKKMIYVSAINGDEMRHLKIMEAKEKFVDALKSSGLEYIIVRPNGFFSDMRDLLDMAMSGKVYLFGDGQYRMNPIHGADLAEVILDLLDSDDGEISVGGPDVFTQKEIGELALRAFGGGRVVLLPDWTRKLAMWLVRTFTGVATYGPVEFFLTMMGRDNVATRYGKHRLEHFFTDEVERRRSATK